MSKDSEQDRLLEHEADGIQEYDNPLPAWWLWIFYATIAYSILYALNIPGVGIGPGRIADYEREVAEARARYPTPQTAVAALSDSALLAMARDALRRERGKVVYDANCAVCHRADGGGSIGPNLTDPYWLHGGRPEEILKIVVEGVPSKGMVAWGPVLQPDEIASVVAYVLSLRGSEPANPKAPQGEPEEPLESPD